MRKMVNYYAIRSIVQPTNGSRNRLKIILMIFAPDCRCVHHVELRLVLQQVATVIHLMRTNEEKHQQRERFVVFSPPVFVCPEPVLANSRVGLNKWYPPQINCNKCVSHRPNVDVSA